MNDDTSIFTSIFILFLILLPTIIKVFLFRKSSYFKITHNGYFTTRFNKGKNGEYLSYKQLRKYEKAGGKFLFNLYLPKENGETTEIDVLLICTNGIFVIESKNYSGWIFGNETQKMWTQTLPQGRGRASQKEHFLNPIMQNKLHIKALKSIIGDDIPIYSVIAFSERCTLKDVTVTDSQIKVINRNHISNTVNQLSMFTNTEISISAVDSIASKLYPFSQVSDDVKEKHINDINIAHKEEERLPENEIIEAKKETVSTDESNIDVHDSQSIENAKCPLCGGTLVLRTAKRGTNSGKQFYGCSNYPKCKYINNIIE